MSFDDRAPYRLPTLPPPPRRLEPLQGNASEFLAWAAFMSEVRSQRHLLAGHAACLALVVPEGLEADHFKACWDHLCHFLQKRYRLLHTGYVLNFERDDRRKGEDFGESVADHRFLLGIAKAAADLPPSFLGLADAVLMPRKPSGRDIAAAGHLVAGFRFTDEEIELALRLPAKRIGEFLRAGRPHRMIRDGLRRSVAALDQPTIPSRAVAGSSLTLDSLPGLGEAAEWGRQLAVDLADWKAGKLPWSACDRGILLSGPPGTGKTSFARALAGTCGVPLVLGSLGRWQAAGHLGQMLRAMRASFDEARKLAPSILLIDELDAAGDRGRMDADDLHYGGQVVAALLECLDGAEAREGVVIVGATNWPEHIDPAIRRPGRLDRHVVIPLPDREARVEILRLHGADLPHPDLDRVAGRLEGRSGAEIEMVVKAARRRARVDRRDLEIDDLLAELPPTVPIPADVRHRAAVHEAGHAVVAHALGYGVVKRLSIATELDRRSGTQVGGGATIERMPMGHRTKEDFLVEIAVIMAGGAAEELLLGERSAGSGGDLNSDLARATVLAGRMVASTGLVGTHTFLASAEPDDVMTAVRMIAEVRMRVEGLLRQATDVANSVLGPSTGIVERIARELAGQAVIEGVPLEEALGEVMPAVEGTFPKQSIG